MPKFIVPLLLHYVYFTYYFCSVASLPLLPLPQPLLSARKSEDEGLALAFVPRCKTTMDWLKERWSRKNSAGEVSPPANSSTSGEVSLQQQPFQSLENTMDGTHTKDLLTDDVGGTDRGKVPARTLFPEASSPALQNIADGAKGGMGDITGDLTDYGRENDLQNDSDGTTDVREKDPSDTPPPAAVLQLFEDNVVSQEKVDFGMSTPEVAADDKKREAKKAVQFHPMAFRRRIAKGSKALVARFTWPNQMAAVNRRRVLEFPPSPESPADFPPFSMDAIHHQSVTAGLAIAKTNEKLNQSKMDASPNQYWQNCSGNPEVTALYEQLPRQRSRRFSLGGGQRSPRGNPGSCRVLSRTTTSFHDNENHDNAVVRFLFCIFISACFSARFAH